MRLIWVLLASLLCASAVAGAGLVLKQNEMRHEPWMIRGERARRALAEDEERTRRLLAATCQRDLHVDRLLLELSAGARETDAEQQAQKLSKLWNAEVALFWEHKGTLSILASTDQKLGSAITTLDTLHRLQKGRAALQGHLPMLMDACVATREDNKLWLVIGRPLSAVLVDNQLPPLEGFDYGELRADENAVDALRTFELSSGRTFVVRAEPIAETDDRWFAMLALLSAAGFCFGGALAAFLTRRAPVDDAVLTAIEDAAERVAQGDLSSQIGLTVSGRADLTLRKFDRMTAELRETRGKLAEAERAAAWQDIARRIAHEIKNPLSPIKMAIETLRKAHEKELASFDEIFDESTRAIREEVERMEHIVREFSEFARLPKARPGAFNLMQLVHETAALYTHDDVQLQLPDLRDCLVHADREQLAQVLINLLTNAYDAVRGNPHKQVVVGIAQDERLLRMWVDDSGPGVPESDRERIFEPYITGKTHGTGLGLSIVRRIVQDHGGTIVVQQSALGGARFLLTLPNEMQSAR